MKISETSAGFKPITHDRPLLEKEIDAYKMKGKLPEPTVCPECNAIFHKGHWQWGAAPEGAHEEMCPACHRIHDNYPAGFVTLEGPFFTAHSEEIMHMVRNLEQKEKAEHPLKRIVAIEQQGDAVLVTTTDIHLARGIGEALRHAYHGEVEMHYHEGENLLRVHWKH